MKNINYQDSKLLNRFFFPYLAVILLSAGMFTAVYTVAWVEIRNNTLEMQKSMVEQSRTVIDYHLHEIETAAIEVQSIPVASTFSRIGSDKLDTSYFNAYSVIKALSQKSLLNVLIQDINIIYRRSGLVLNQARAFDLEGDYARNFSFAEMKYSEFLSFVFDRYHSNTYYQECSVNLGNGKKTVIPYFRTLGYQFSDPQAVIFLSIDSEQIRTLLPGPETPGLVNFHIINGEGIKILELHPDSEQPSDCMTFSAESGINDWTYVLSRSRYSVFQRLVQLRNGAIILISVLLVAGIIFTWIMTRRNIKPIQLMLNDYSILKKRIIERKPYLRNIFFYQWMSGHFKDVQAIKNFSSEFKPIFNKRRYLVCLFNCDIDNISFSNLDELRIVEIEERRRMIIKLLPSTGIDEDCLFIVDYDKIGLLFCSDLVTENEFRAMIDLRLNACRRILNESGIRGVVIGGGTVCTTMTTVPESFCRARDALSCNTVPENGIIWYDADVFRSVTCRYPQEMENRLFNATRTGDETAIREILEEIFAANLEDTNLPVFIPNLLAYRLLDTLMKLKEQSPDVNAPLDALQDEILSRIDTMNSREILKRCRHYFIKAGEYFKTKESHRHREMMEKIKTFVDNSFTDPNLGLNDVAEALGLSYSYISQIFKEFFGKSFIHYLQEQRIEKAQQLLAQTDIPIIRITEKCGYNSSNAFRKAFKRYHNISASEYRAASRTNAE